MSPHEGKRHDEKEEVSLKQEGERTLSKGAQREGPGGKANEQEATCTWLKKKKNKPTR